MVDYAVINGTDAELTNINAGGSDVPARSILAQVTLTDTELGDLIDAAGENAIALMNVSPSAAEKAAVAAVLLDSNLSGIDLSTAVKREAFKLKKGLQELHDIADQIGA